VKILTAEYRGYPDEEKENAFHKCVDDFGGEFIGCGCLLLEPVTRDVEAGFDDDVDEAAIKRALADAGFQNINITAEPEHARQRAL
jgi:hypothetical protein